VAHGKTPLIDIAAFVCIMHRRFAPGQTTAAFRPPEWSRIKDPPGPREFIDRQGRWRLCYYRSAFARVYGLRGHTWCVTLSIEKRTSAMEGTPTLVKDSNGNTLSDGDSVTVIKDLKVKGTSLTLKRGTLIKNIRLTSEQDEIECNAEKVKGLVLKTCFLKKV
jgi:protein PhnA